MGGKGSGRPRKSYKPMSKVFADLEEEISDLHAYVFKKCNSLTLRLEYHRTKHEKLEQAKTKK